jgi:hypothetical protein
MGSVFVPRIGEKALPVAKVRQRRNGWLTVFGGGIAGKPTKSRRVNWYDRTGTKGSDEGEYGYEDKNKRKSEREDPAGRLTGMLSRVAIGS